MIPFRGLGQRGGSAFRRELVLKSSAEVGIMSLQIITCVICTASHIHLVGVHHSLHRFSRISYKSHRRGFDQNLQLEIRFQDSALCAAIPSYGDASAIVQRFVAFEHL